jgi:membrane-associated phospholipid phosphatase
VARELSPRGSWDPRSPSTRHGPVAQLLLAWAPLGLVLLAYAVAEWIDAPLVPDAGSSNRIGSGLHVGSPALVDRALFGGVPSVWLQERLVDGSAHWYDAVAALVYATHFVSVPLLTAVVWFVFRDRFAAWLTTVLTFTALGVAVYVVYPAAPPWLASDRGVIGTVDRISSPGWDYLGLHAIGRLTVAGQEGSNPVAAMPSLHAGCALLVALFLWPLASRSWRLVLAAYVMLMALALVYSGEHYVVDVLAGWATAGAAAAVGSQSGGWQGRSGAMTPRDAEPSGPAIRLTGSSSHVRHP